VWVGPSCGSAPYAGRSLVGPSPPVFPLPMAATRVMSLARAPTPWANLKALAAPAAAPSPRMRQNVYVSSLWVGPLCGSVPWVTRACVGDLCTGRVDPAPAAAPSPRMGQNERTTSTTTWTIQRSVAPLFVLCPCVCVFVFVCLCLRFCLVCV